MRMLKKITLTAMTLACFVPAMCGSAAASVSAGHNGSTGARQAETVTSQVQQTQTDNSARESAVWLSTRAWCSGGRSRGHSMPEP